MEIPVDTGHPTLRRCGAKCDSISKLVETLLALYPERRQGNLILLERMHNPGFGASYRDGFQQVLAQPWCQAVITMDADFSHTATTWYSARATPPGEASIAGACGAGS